MPSISVLLPVREPAPWLSETLVGLMRQETSDWELVVVVHGPDESTSALISQFEFDARITQAPSELRFPEVLNLGLEVCRAPFVARIDSDDVPLPNRLTSALDLLETTPDAWVVAGLADFIDPNGNVTGSQVHKSKRQALQRRLRWRNPIVHSAASFRRSLIKQIGGYSLSALGCEDYELWLRVLSVGKIEIVDVPVVQHRVHSQQSSRVQSVSRESARTLLDAKIAIAKTRDESRAAARFRHFAWNARQESRRMFSL